MSVAVPLTPFPVLADTLAALVRRETGGLQLIEVEAARDPASAFARGLPDAALTTRRLLEAQALLARLAGRESDVRAILEGRA